MNCKAMFARPVGTCDQKAVWEVEFDPSDSHRVPMCDNHKKELEKLTGAIPENRLSQVATNRS